MTNLSNLVVSPCLHPRTVYNPYCGYDVQVSCGKCEACCNTHAAKWVQRLDLEAQCHKYTLFVTLTYDDFHVPQVVRLRKDSYPNAAYIDSETGQIFDVRDIKESFDSADWQYIADSKVLNVLSKRDFQKFIKLLRYYFTQTDETAKLRYYLCGEYGPRTYRPHGHMLLFFDSERCLSQIEILLSKSWPHGHIHDPHLVHGSASEYVAAYVNSLSSLPRIYLHKWLKPFTLFSKTPSIGSLYPCLKEVRELVAHGVDEFRCYNAKHNEFVNVPLWRSLQSRLYPRLPRFGNLSSFDRIILYRFAEELASRFDSATDCARYLKHKFVDSRCDTFLGRYFTEISKKHTYKYHFLLPDKQLPYDYKNLPFLPKDFVIPQALNAVRLESSEFCFDSLVRFSRTALLFAHQRVSLGFSFNQYFNFISDYYDKKSYKKLKRDYLLQDVYFKIHPAWHIIYFDFGFYEKVTNTSFSCLSNESKFMLTSLFNGNVPLVFNNNICDFVLDIPDITTIDNFMNHKLLHMKISHDLIKTKENNDYALMKKDKFKNIIHYQNL